MTPVLSRVTLAGWAIAAIGLLGDCALIGLHLARRPWDADFRIVYAAATVGRGAGWSLLFDEGRIHAVEAAIGPAPYWAYLNPPPLAWLAAPFSYLDYRAALAAWTVLLVAALAAALWLAMPAIRGARMGWALAATFWAFPVVFGISEGQPTAVLMLGVVAAWRLSGAGRDGLAGAALGLTLLKPHTAWLVPIAFAVAGRPRVLLGYAGVVIPITALSALSLGEAGLQAWLSALTQAKSGVPAPLFIFPAFLPGPEAFAAEGLAVVVTIAAAWRHRQSATPALLIAIGVAGSLLAAPYLNIQDLSLLVVAGWLLWPEVGSWRQKALMGTVFVALLISPGTSQLVLPAEAIWLLANLVGSGNRDRADEGARRGTSGPA